jgi:hypothetical protein
MERKGRMQKIGHHVRQANKSEGQKGGEHDARRLFCFTPGLATRTK